MASVKATDLAQKRHAAASGFAAGVASAAGDTTIVANPGGGQKIRVARYFLSPAADVVAHFKSSGAGRISGDRNMAAKGEAAGNEAANFGHFETAAGEDLVLNLGGAVSVGWDVTYTLEPAS